MKTKELRKIKRGIVIAGILAFYMLILTGIFSMSDVKDVTVTTFTISLVFVFLRYILTIMKNKKEDDIRRDSNALYIKSLYM